LHSFEHQQQHGSNTFYVGAKDLFNAACPNMVPHVCREVRSVPIEPWDDGVQAEWREFVEHLASSSLKCAFSLLLFHGTFLLVALAQEKKEERIYIVEKLVKKGAVALSHYFLDFLMPPPPIGPLPPAFFCRTISECMVRTNEVRTGGWFEVHGQTRYPVSNQITTGTLPQVCCQLYSVL
jgi:hypothetical protein